MVERNVDDRRQQILDEFLVLGSREGRRTAIEQLLTRWQPRLWRHARRLTGRDDAAWDVLQETLMSITRGIRKLDDPAYFRRWAYRIATRRAADWHRRNQRQMPTTELPDDEPAPDQDDADTASDVALVREGLARLPGDRQALLALRYLEGFEVTEIAVILAVPEGTVKSRLHQARRHLKDIIERMQS